MQKHFMIDIETTGTNPKRDDILQIGVLELEFMFGYWRPGKSMELEIHTGKTPQSEFARTYQTALFEKCQNTPYMAPAAIRAGLLRFFKSCGATSPDVYLMGWNVTGLDIPFLVHHGYLEPHRYEQDEYGKDQAAGDFHYRVYEMQGALGFAGNVLGYLDRKELIDVALSADTIIPLPTGAQHDALFDCYRQAKILNGLITMVAQGRIKQ